MNKILLALILLLNLSNSTEAQTYSEYHKTVDLHRETRGEYGHAVAISGDYAAVGTPRNTTDSLGNGFVGDKGAVYILKQNSCGVWETIQKMQVSLPGQGWGDKFGVTLAMDGNLLAIGTEKVAPGGLQYAGSVYIYKLNTTTGFWEYEDEVISSDLDADDYFGSQSIDLMNGYLVIGAHEEDEDENGANTLSKAGSVYVFERQSNGQWIEMQKLVSQFRHASEEFGATVAIWENRLVVGAPYGGGQFTSGPGEITIFELDTTSNIWIWKQTINSGATSQFRFGNNVDIQGDIIVVGEPSRKVSFHSNAGVVTVFEPIGTGSNTWQLTQTITSQFVSANQGFGELVKLDSNQLLIGCRADDYDATGNGGYLNYAGAFYLFELNGSNLWTQSQKIVASDRDSEDSFGGALDIDENNIIVGAFREDHNLLGADSINNAGAAYFFSALPNPTTTAILNITACNDYHAPSGNSIWTSTGTYIDTIPNAAGCDSVMTINVTIHPIDTGVTINGILLTSSSLVGTYQWIDCSTNMPVVGATNRSFNPIVSGTYAVVVGDNGCTDTSECIAITIVGVGQVQTVGNFSAYPNPTSGVLSIDLKRIYENVSIELLNVAGQSIQAYDVEGKQLIDLDLMDLENGLYFVRIRTEEGEQALIKVVKLN